jgi:hypothetical protein
MMTRDAPEQKHLKAQTQAARVFRSREYDAVVQGAITDSSFDSYVSLPPRRMAQDRLRDLGSQVSPAISPVKSVKARVEEQENETEAVEA